MSKHLKIEQQAAAWLARQDGEGWSAADQVQLTEWLAQDTAHRVAYLRLAAAWNQSKQLAPGASGAAAPPPAPDPAAQRPPHPRFSTWRIAATILVMAGAMAGWLALRPGLAEARYETALGARQTHTLVDGSRLTLNTATLLRARISQSERIVWIDRGEAYFDIAHDREHPFVVVSGDQRITVLGTRFAVRRMDDGTRVMVVDGRVRVEHAQRARQAPVELIKHQQVVATPAGMLKSEQSGDKIDQGLSWRDGKLIFDQITLAAAADEFNRYNQTQLVIADPQAAGLRIGGRFDVNNVKGFADLLARGFGLDVRAAGGRITVATNRAERARAQ